MSYSSVDRGREEYRKKEEETDKQENGILSEMSRESHLNKRAQRSDYCEIAYFFCCRVISALQVHDRRKFILHRIAYIRVRYTATMNIQANKGRRESIGLYVKWRTMNGRMNGRCLALLSMDGTLTGAVSYMMWTALYETHGHVGAQDS